MKALFRNARVYENGSINIRDILFDGASVSSFDGDASAIPSFLVFDNIAVFPGFCDVHVHLREPGFSYKETIKSGTLASAAGGYTAVCSMPNLNPAPYSIENLNKQLEIINRDACIRVIPYGRITKDGSELADMSDIAPYVVGFSDDGKGVQGGEDMLSAMEKVKTLGKMIVAHCEDDSLLCGGYIHDGDYARAHGHLGICSESEWGQIKRDIELVKKSGCKYHVCHISTKESVELIRAAKAEGVDISCETAPHYILLDDSCLREHGRFKMNPPLRSPADKEAILEGLLDGTIDFIATDHAPHSAEEKSKGLRGSAMGIVGIETAFPVLYTGLVLGGIMTLEELIKLLCDKPRERFEITSDVGFTIFDLGKNYDINPDKFMSMGRATPFEGHNVFGKCIATVYENKCVYLDKEYFGGETNGKEN